MSIAKTRPRTRRAKIMVTSIKPPGLADCCWAWLGAHDAAGRARVKVAGRNRQVRRMAIAAEDDLVTPADSVIALCGHSWCVNRAHLVHGPACECRALGRHGWIGVGDLWVAKRLLAERGATTEALSQCWGISPRLIEDVLQRVE